MTGRTYPATAYLRRLTADNGWCSELIRDRHGEPVAVVAVHLGPDWTDAVAIKDEDRCARTASSRGSVSDRAPSTPAGNGKDVADWSEFELHIPHINGDP